jgi:hypothetical protein
MGCSLKAVYEDEEDWERLQKENNLPLEWKVYSREHHFARQMYSKGYKNIRLKLAVNHAIELEKLQLRHAKEWQELEQLVELELKYK